MIRRVLRILFSLAAGACLAAPRVACAGDDGARAKFLADGDAKAFAAALRASADPADREDVALADLAAGGDAAKLAEAAPPFLAALFALREGSLLGARPPVQEADRDGGLAGTWLQALCLARGGDEAGAETRIALARAPTPADAVRLALRGLALPPLDRAATARVAQGAVTRAAAAGKLAEAAAIGEAAVRVDPVVGVDALVHAARALRRGGKALEALNLLVGSAAVRAGIGLPALRLDRALSRRRVGDAAGAAGEARAVASPLETAWAFEALSKAAGAAPASAGPPPALFADAASAALAHLLACLGAATTPEDVAAAAKARGVGASDPTFVRETLAQRGFASIEVAGDPAPLIAALARGTPVLWVRLARRGPRSAEEAVVLRAHDAVCGLCLASPSDLGVLDVVPDAWLAKARATIPVPAARAGELDALRATPAARLGAWLSEALASPAPEKAAAALVAHTGELPGRAVLDVYAAHLAGRGEPSERSPSTAALAYAALARGAAVPPRTAAECVALAEARNDSGDADAALALLAEARRQEGDGVDLRLLEFGVYSLARRRAEALAALDEAALRGPLDVRVLLFRGAALSDRGDVAGARAAWRRLLDARPDHAGAAEALVDSLLREGSLGEASRVAETYAAASTAPVSAASLRRRVEMRALDGAVGPRDVLPYVRSPNVATRADVAALLARMDPRGAEPTLRTLLSDAEEVVRRRAAASYARSEWAAYVASQPVAFAALVGTSSGDASPAVREAATAALAKVPGDAGETALLARFSDPSSAVRAAVADVLFGRDGPRVRAALVAALSDGDLVVRKTAVRALTSIAGTDRGFVADAPPDERAAAIASWKSWLSGN